MVLLKYFKKDTNPDSSLSERMPSAAISSMHNEVGDLIIAVPSDSRKWGPHQNYTDEERAWTGKRAAKFGVTNTVRHFGKQFAARPLKQSTVKTWMMNYKKELANRVKVGWSLTIEKLEMIKRGNPYLLGEEMDRQLQEYIKTWEQPKLSLTLLLWFLLMTELLNATIVTCLRVMVVTSSVQSIGQNTFWISWVMLNKNPLQKHQYQVAILEHKRNNFYFIFRPLLRWKIFQIS